MRGAVERSPSRTEYVVIRLGFTGVFLFLVSVPYIVVVRVRMPCTSGGQVRFQPDDDYGRHHRDQAGKRLVSFAEGIRQTWIGQGIECGWKEMDEGGRDQDASSEVLA